MRYRKKPVVVEAVKWDPDFSRSATPTANRSPWPPSWGDAPSRWRVGFVNGALVIPTLEGDHYANPGDWIIRGVKGEFYPCKPDIFAETYEPAEEPHPAEDAAPGDSEDAITRRLREAREEGRRAELKEAAREVEALATGLDELEEAEECRGSSFSGAALATAKRLRALAEHP